MIQFSLERDLACADAQKSLKIGNRNFVCISTTRSHLEFQLSRDSSTYDLKDVRILIQEDGNSNSLSLVYTGRFWNGTELDSRKNGLTYPSTPPYAYINGMFPSDLPGPGESKVYGIWNDPIGAQIPNRSISTVPVIEIDGRTAECGVSSKVQTPNIRTC